MFNKLVNWGFRQYLKSYNAKLDAHYNNPIGLQKAQLREIVKCNMNTIFGLEHSFKTIEDSNDYLRNVPIFSYSNLWPFVERVVNNESNVLTKEKVIWVSKTAGTSSGSSKYNPLTRSALRKIHFVGAWYTLASLYLNSNDMDIFAQRNLLIGGGMYGNYNPTSSVVVGDISGIIIKNLPKYIQPFYYPDVDTATLPSYEEKIAKTAKSAITRKDITMLGGTPTWNLSLFKIVLESTGASNLLEIWPNLKAYVHGGVSFGPYRTQFEELIPKSDFIYKEVYNASEGFFAFQDSNNKDDLLLILDNGIYYEFLSIDALNVSNYNETISLEDVEIGVSYAMVISTISGLYRYLVGDVVTFTCASPYRIKVTGRTQEYINAFGEDLQFEQAQRALISTCREIGVSIKDYTIAPKYIRVHEKGFHQWLIEFVDPPQNMSLFEKILDNKVQLENSNYLQKRANDFVIESLRVTSLPKGHFEKWLRVNGKLGGQAKIPKLLNNRKIIDSILDLPK